MSDIIRQPKGQPTGGEFASHSRTEASVSLTALRPFEHQTPSEVDDVIADAFGRIRDIQIPMWAAEDELSAMDAWQRRWADQPVPEREPWNLRFARDKYQDLDGKKRAKLEAKIAAAAEQIKEIRTTDIEPRDAEWRARGRWNRFFLVTSSGNGHVHSSMSCSTCYPRTEFIWLTEESGKTEDEIVERARDQACTVCWPSAPVADKRNPKPGEFEDPKVKAAREQRAREKAEREAARDAKAVFMPDGSYLREADQRPTVDGHGKQRRGVTGEVIKTEIAADRRGVELMIDFPKMTIQHRGDGDWNSDVFLAYDEQKLGTLRNIIIGLALKRGQTPEEVHAYLVDKAKKKVKRDGWPARRESDWGEYRADEA